MFGGYCAKLVYMGIIDGITVRPNFVQANGNKYNTFTLQQHKRRCCWLWSSQRFCELTLKHSTVGELKWVNTQIRLTMNGIGLAKWNIVTWLKELTAHWICPLHACRVQRKWDCHIMWTRFTVLFGIFFVYFGRVLSLTSMRRASNNWKRRNVQRTNISYFNVLDYIIYRTIFVIDISHCWQLKLKLFSLSGLYIALHKKTVKFTEHAVNCAGNLSWCCFSRHWTLAAKMENNLLIDVCVIQMSAIICKYNIFHHHFCLRLILFCFIRRDDQIPFNLDCMVDIE